MNFRVEEGRQAFFQHVELLWKPRFRHDFLLAALDVLAVFQPLRQFLDLAHGIAVFLDFLEQFDLQRRRVDGEQRARVSHIYFLLLQRHLHLCRQFQQSQKVRHRRAALADALRHFVLRHAVAFEQMLEGERDFNVVEVLALNVLDECHFHHVFVGDGSDVGRNRHQLGELRGSPTAFSGDDLIASVGHLAQRNRLDDADLSDALGEFLQGRFVELATRLVRVRVDLVECHLVDGR